MIKDTIYRLLDDVGGMAAMRIASQLMAKIQEREGLASALLKVRNAGEIMELVRQLTGNAQPEPEKTPPAPVAEEPDADEDAAPRNPTAHLYNYDPNRKPAQRKRENAAAMALLAQIDSGEVDGNSLTAEQKAVLAKYSGTGGALVGADGKKGSAYEYYTPKPIAEGIWDLLNDLGFGGGKILDPCAGVGIFGATAPASAAVDAVELNQTSGRVNSLVNNGPSYTTTISPFEKVAANTPDEIYDAVVTNVPFGDLADRGGNQLHDPRYQKEPLQNYFILRSLEKLKPGGLAAFITPPRCVSGRGGKEEELRIQASYMAEFLGAYRLPNSVFGTAAADTMTDVIVFRKYSRDALDKIAELKEQAPATLSQANVLWQPFIEGQYFAGEGKRFVLGDFIPKDPNKFRDVDRVVNPASVAEIGKMLKKFPGSRVDWDLLGTTETLPIVYRDGDTITQAGQTLQMVDGAWVPLKASDSSREMAELLSKLASPYAAFENRVTWQQAVGLVDFMVAQSQTLDIPSWLSGTVGSLRRLADAGEQGKYWNAGVVGMAAKQVLDEHLADGAGFNYAQEYAALSDAMQRVSTVAKTRPASLYSRIKDGLATITTHYSKKNGFSAVWRGDVLADVAATVEVTADGSFEGLRYRTKSEWVDMDDARAIYGESFDPINDDAWCISADGKQVTRADDYYVGSYAEFLRRADADIAAAADPAIKAKLLRQKLDAEKRIDRVDVSAITFNLFSPHATPEEKAEFLRRFVHPSADVIYDEKTGEKRVDIDIRGSNLTDDEKLLNRVGDYMKNGTITLGGLKLGMSDAEALGKLRRIVNTANEQFNGWARSNGAITSRLQALADDPQRLRFRAVDDESPMQIQGMNPDLTLHGYQNSFVRKQAREFGGLNGFGVGLGKTFTALATVQYAQSIGVKKKTLFVVPNSVLSNWRKEASRAYASTDDCLFVGLRINKKQRAVVDSSAYDEDLTAIMENRHAKIFMTLEAFERLRLRDETIADYEQFMRRADASFAESEDKKQDERNKGKQAGLLAILSSKAGNAPYLEDLGIDSIVIDEAHMFKNSASVVDFKSAKFLSLSDASKRGIDAQAKAWYVRGQSVRGDGVLGLTATPITNSPLEIYAMLSLCAGHERVNDMCLGIKGADNFMEMMCAKVNEDDVTMDGVARTTDVFVGLNNVGVLRKALGSVATIKTAEDVGEQIIVPDRDEAAASVVLTPEIRDRLKMYKGAFRFAIDMLTEKNPNRGDPDAFEAVAAHFGEELNLIGHPFNLINKMTMLIADPELDQRATFYSFAPAQADKAAQVVAQFNGKKYEELRPRPAPMTEESAIVGRKTTKDVSGGEVVLLKIEVRAKIIEQTRIVIDTIDPDNQSAFEAMAEKAGLDLDVTVPPKLAAMLENYRKEEANPRGVTDDGASSLIVKQIVFCDILPLHNKIKRLLSKRAGVPSSAIAIITGKTNNSPDEILAVQDGFNAHGEDNKYRAVIANEKAEVGINLQKGTQAIHHLTIGWTPDSLEQRNGRGVRQGNRTGKVTIYHYDADGTFDTSKRAMVNKKADWISQVMDVNGGESIKVSGGLSKEQMEALIDVVGDADAMRRMQDTMAAKEAESRAATNRDRQMINADTIAKQRSFIVNNPDATQFVVRKTVALWKLRGQMQVIRTRINNPKASATAIAKNEGLLSELAVTAQSLERQIDQSATFHATQYSSQTGKYEVVGEAMTVGEILGKFATASKQKEANLVEMLTGQSYPRHGIQLIDGGPITNDWQAEVDMAQSMIDEAVANFGKQAKESGAFPHDVAKALSDGTGVMFNGKPVLLTMLFEHGEWLGVLDESKNGCVVYSDAGTGMRKSLVDTFEEAKPVYPGSDRYDACLQRAAAIEDAIAELGEVRNPFSLLIPLVAKYRKTEQLAEYSAYHYGLPAPYYPKVFYPEHQATPVIQHIIESQKAVIKRFTDRGYFVVSSDLAVTDYNGKQERSTRIEYAKAHGLKLILADFDNIYWLAQEVRPMLSLDAFTAALMGDDLAGLKANATAYIESVVGGWLDTTGIDLLNGGLLPYDFALALAAKEKQLAPPAAPEQAQPAASPVVSSEADPLETVGIRGNTKPHFPTIKYVAGMYGKGKYKWDGKAAQWNVLRATWDKLVADYPQIAKELQLCKATYKL